MYILLSACVSADPSFRICLQFDIGHVYENLSRISIFGYNIKDQHVSHMLAATEVTRQERKHRAVLPWQRFQCFNSNIRMSAMQKERIVACPVSVR